MRGFLTVFGIAAGLVGCLPASSQFAHPVSFYAGTEPRFALPSDVNSDGKVDLVVSRSSGRGEIAILLGSGDGKFSPVASIGGSGASRPPFIGDLNGDGKEDLAISDFAVEGSLSVLLGHGDGTFAEPVQHVVGPHPSSAKAGDFNGDGKIDLVLVNYAADELSVSEALTGRVTVLLGRGDGSFAAPSSLELGRRPRSLTVGDLNGDGKLDVAVIDESSRQIFLLQGRGDGSFFPQASFRVGYEPVAISHPIDLNRDGNLDLMVGVPNGVVLFFGRGDGRFDRGAEYQTLPTRSVWMADFDHDGFVDIAAARQLLHGDGAGHFARFALPARDGSDSFVAAADFNGDGWPDLAVTDQAHNQISIYLNRSGSL